MKLFVYCFRDFDEKKHFDTLQDRFDLSYAATAEYPNNDNASLAKGFEAISITVVSMDRQLLERFHALGVRYILSRTIGVDHIDLEAAKELGLRVAHVTYEPSAVANYTIMLMMMGLRKMMYIQQSMAMQDFSLRGKCGRDIGSCTVGIIGAGRIGSTVIRHLVPFGCRILLRTSHPKPELEDLCKYADLETLYRECDVISLHIPADESTFHLLNEAAFAAMKPGMMIVNTARGTLIDTHALIAALTEGKLAGAALDVLEDESGLYYHNRVGECIGYEHFAQLKSFPNVILSPHTAFYTDEVVFTMAEKAVQCLADMKEGVENPLVIF